MKDLQKFLGASRIRTIIFPGLVAAISVHVYITPAVREIGLTEFPINETAIFVAEIAFFGLVFSSAYRVCLYFLEGIYFSRFLAWRTRILARRANSWSTRLRDLRQRRSKLNAEEKLLAGRLAEKLLDFPLAASTDHTLTPLVERPTMLGNIIASYERYPDTRYGINGEHYWYHFFCLAPSESLVEFNEKSDAADSLALACVASLVGATAQLTFLALALIGTAMPEEWPVESPLTVDTAVALLGFDLLLAWSFYRMALPAFRELGRTFAALVDITMDDMWAFIESVPVPPPERPAKKARRLRLFLRFNQSSTSDVAQTVTPNGDNNAPKAGSVMRTSPASDSGNWRPLLILSLTAALGLRLLLGWLRQKEVDRLE